MLRSFSAKKYPKPERREYMKAFKNISRLNKLSAARLSDGRAFVAQKEVLYLLYPNRNKQGEIVC
jgi:hypothetical protein